MSNISKKVEVKIEDGDKHVPTGNESYWFWCPGCNFAHGYNTGIGPGPHWTFNGDMEAPTFGPSLLVHGKKRCHMFLEAGKIRFLDDCQHELAGKTVDLPPLPDWLK